MEVNETIWHATYLLQLSESQAEIKDLKKQLKQKEQEHRALTVSPSPVSPYPRGTLRQTALYTRADHINESCHQLRWVVMQHGELCAKDRASNLARNMRVRATSRFSRVSGFPSFNHHLVPPYLSPSCFHACDFFFLAQRASDFLSFFFSRTY